jgi:nucleoside-diphosphate-sugar epimerase
MAINSQYIGIIGATSLVGQQLIPKLLSDGCVIKAFSTREIVLPYGSGVELGMLNAEAEDSYSDAKGAQISHWFCLAPIWVVPDYFSLLKTYGVKRVVALSSTSRYTKHDSKDLSEKQKASLMVEGEEKLQTWAEHNNVEWLILRPTLIYGHGQDENVSEIARFVRRWGFFPVLGKAIGLRQPVHVDDVAEICRMALLKSETKNRAYNVSGGETLTYREMVERIFSVLHKPVRMFSVPVWIFKLSIFFLRRLPRYRNLTTSMAVRMNQDLVFDYSEAARDLSYTPRLFALCEKDIVAK